VIHSQAAVFLAASAYVSNLLDPCSAEAKTVLLLTFINVTGASLNPARSFGPTVFVGGKALAQLWLFLLAPAIGGLLAGVFAWLLWKVEPTAGAHSRGGRH
jgi:hypothetical protein